MLPSLNGLRAFEAAARHMSFTRAAAELNVTQTAISHQIRRLEEQLGVALFIRRNRALALTHEAQDYLPSIRSAFEDLRHATEKLRRPSHEGKLTVSTTASLATKWLVLRVAAFQDANPGIDIHITTSAHLVDFRREDVDMAVRFGRGHWPGLRADWLMAEDIFPVCQPGLTSDGKPLLRPEDLAHHTLLHTTVSREDWQLWLTAAGLPLSIASRRGLTFDQSFMAIQAAVQGLGVALGRTHLVEDDIAAGRLVAPFHMVLPQDAGYYVVTPETTADAPKVARFRDWLIASATPGALASSAA
jgi:LysR family transcriptional regulator, glycine cleavage system transcriptional activator